MRRPGPPGSRPDEPAPGATRQSVGATEVPAGRGGPLPVVVARPRRRGRALLLQLRAVAERVAGVLAPLVLGRSRPLGLARPSHAYRPGPEPQAGVPDDAHRRSPGGGVR